ncbi:HEAT repeat domain-containing protein [Kitasatospora sp. NPDC004531]
MGPKKLALRLALTGLRDEAEQGFKRRANRTCSQTDLQKAVRATGLPDTATFAGQRISEWLPPDERAARARIPHRPDVLLAVVAVWSSWAGVASLTDSGKVDHRWMRAQGARWRRLLDDARAERAVRTETAALVAPHSAAVKAYLKRVREVHRRLNLDVLGHTSRAGEQPAIEIRQVFMPQQCRGYLSHVPGEVRRLLFADRASDSELPPGLAADEAAKLRTSYHSQPARSVLEILASEPGRRLVVLGDPGAGKSTLSKYVALALAGAADDVPPELAPLTGLAPVVVELRHFAEQRWRDRSLEDFLEHANDEDRMGLTRPLLDELLVSGRALVFFDGLDEIFDPKVRAETARRITAFAAAHPQTRVVVTSREFGYRANDFAAAGFTQVMLQDLTRPQVEEFIHRWYAAAHPEKPSLSAQLTQRLSGAVRGVRAVAELAGNPLLLTILASVGLGRTIPRERREVYAHAVDVLTEQWDSGAKFLTPHPPASSGAVEALEWLEPRNRRKLLQRIARHMQEGAENPGGTYLKHAQLTGLISDFLQQSTGLLRSATDIAAQHIVERLRVRNFLLAHFGDGVYGFVHRAFLEYLAAEDLRERVFQEEMSRDELLEFLGRRAEDPAWHEVLLLVVGGLNHRQVASFIALLLGRHRERDGRRNAPMLMLAVRVLAEVDETNHRSGSPNGDPASSVARQSRAVVSALVGALSRSGVMDVEEVLPALATFDRFWPDRDRFLRWHYAQSTVHDPYAASRVAAVLSRDEAESIRQASIPWNASMRTFALEVLAERWPEEARTVVMAAVSDPEWEVRRGALEVLGERWPDEEARAVVMAALSDSEWVVRSRALRVLAEGWSDAEARAAVMTSAASDPDVYVRDSALRVLGERWPDEEARAVVMAALSDPEPVVRVSALDVLGERWPDDEARGVVMASVSDVDMDVRAGALRVLGERWPDEEARAVVMAALSDPEPVVRVSALDVLGERWPDDEARAVVMASVSDVDMDVRDGALDVLGERWPDEEARAAVTVAVSDPEWFVRCGALDVLGKRWPDGRARAVVTAAVSDPEPMVRISALEVLADRWPDEETRAVVTAGVSDIDMEVRAGALWRLGQRWPDEETRAIAMAGVSDPEPGVCRGALQILGQTFPGRDACSLIAGVAASDIHLWVCKDAVALLAAQFPDVAWSVIGATLEGDRPLELKVQAVKLLALLWPEHPETVLRIQAVAAHEEQELRRTAGEALRFLRHQSPTR